MGEDICNIAAHQGMLYKIYKKKWKKNHKTEKWAKHLNKHFRKNDIQLANKHKKRFNFISHQGNTNWKHSKIPLTLFH